MNHSLKGIPNRLLCKSLLTVACIAAMLFYFTPDTVSMDRDLWVYESFHDLCRKYLGASPPNEANHDERAVWLQRLARTMGEMLALHGTSGVPAEDIALLALFEARKDFLLGPEPALLPISSPQTKPEAPSINYESFEEEIPQLESSDIQRGREGIRQAEEKLAQLPLTERLVMTGDVASVLLAATVPENPDLTSVSGRARINFVLRAFSGDGIHRLGNGYFLVQMIAAGGAPDSSSVGGPQSFSAFNSIATDRSLFNESLSRGNIYLSKVFYEQEMDFSGNNAYARAGILDLSDYFDASDFANNEARQFLNSSMVNSTAFTTGISAPGLMAEYHHTLGRDRLRSLVVRAAYGVSQTDRAFTSPLWAAELELQTVIGGRPGKWRIGGSAGRRASLGGVQGLHASVDQWLGSRLGIFGRYALTSTSAGALAFSPVRQSYSGGIQWRFVDRNDRVSAWSIGFSQSFGVPTTKPVDSERVLETYYRWQWTRNISITPDFQLILGSGGSKQQGTQAVFGTRLNFIF